MNISQAGIEIGAVTLSYFGLIVVGSIVGGGILSYWKVKSNEDAVDHIIDMLTWAFIIGLVLARLFYVWNPPPSVAHYYDRSWYLSHPFDFQIGVLALWSGGLGRAGALTGGVLGIGLYVWRAKLPWRQWSDHLIVGALLGLGMAPWANVVTQKLYGPPTSLPWGMAIYAPAFPYDDFVTYPPLETRFHPTSAYLSIWTFLVAGLVWIIGQRYADLLKPGDRFTIGFALYLVGAFVADFLRVDVYRGLINLTGLQFAAVFGIIGLIWVWLTRQNQSA